MDRYEAWFPRMKADMDALLGVPYLFGAKADSWPPKAIDCSGCIEVLFSRQGIPCPHGSWNQHAQTYRVQQPRPGDVGFWAAIDRRTQENQFGIYHAGVLFDEANVLEARALDGDKYGMVILRPKPKWDDWKPFQLAGGWRRFNSLRT